MFGNSIWLRRLWIAWLAAVCGWPSVALQAAVELVPSGAEWRYFPGLTEPSTPDTTAWRRADFNDAAWATGPATFWYGDNFPGTPITDMEGRYTTLYFRRKFNLASTANIESVLLRARCDDGFVAWLNGIELQRYNVADGELSNTAVALAPASPDPAEFVDYPIANPRGLLRAGENLLAVQVLNRSLGSSDVVWDAVLVAQFDEVNPTVVTVLPSAGATVRELGHIEVQFSEPVTGVEAADLLVGGIPATDVLVINAAQYVFTFPKAPAGVVVVQFRSNHGITDLASPPHPLAAFTASYTVDPALVVPGLEISEFLADNEQGLRDEDGDRGDWIELHNASRETVSLAGWTLTDDPENLTRWVFPAVTLGANRYLVIFASAKNRTVSGSRLHTNFKLASNGGYLALVTPGGEIQSEFAPTYPPQRADVSYGRPSGGGRLTGYFPQPTPGFANELSGPGFAPAVAFSLSSRTFNTNLTVALDLDPPAPGAVVRMTTDGTLPTENSPAYAGALVVSNTLHVRARAFAPGLLPGPPRSETYVKLAASVQSVRSDLPIVVLHNFGQGRPPASTTQSAHFELFEPIDGVTTLTNPPTLTSRVGLGSRGSSTLGLEKVSLSLEFRDEFEADRNEAPFGFPADSDWVLYAPNRFEPVMIHNPFMHQLSRDMGRYASRTRFVEVYLVTSGTSAQVTSAHYNGIYVLEEKIKRGPHRVDVEALTPDETRQPYITGGFVMKIDRAGPGDTGFNAANALIQYVDPKEQEINQPGYAAHRQYLQSYMEAFGNALYGPNWLDPLRGYAAFVNVDSWIDHHLLNVLARNVDALRLSAYFHKPRNARLEFGPLWDFDRALGSTDGRDMDPRVWSAPPNGGTDFFNEGTQAWWGRLFQDLEFFQRYIDRYHELRRSHFAIANLTRLVDEFAAIVRPAQPRETARWGTEMRTATGGPGGTYATEVQWMKRWLTNRLDFIDSQFVRPALLLTPSGRLTNSLEVVLQRPAAGTVYYTLDGSDPRLPGGGVSPLARVASPGPIVLTTNARVVVRVMNPAHTALTGERNPPLVSKWSGPSAATYFTTVPPVRITEVHFHPAKPVGNTGFTAADFEFIELKNVGAQSVSLAGFHLGGAITYRFGTTSAVTRLEPEQRVLVVANAAAFRSRYPNVTGVAGEYAGRLDNGDERLSLWGPLEEPISDFTYREDWAPLADGFGFSLVVRDENTAPDRLNEGVQWRLSAAVGGSPGALDPSPIPPPQVYVNEALTHTDPPQLDAVEIANFGPGLQDISGWWLTDDYRTPKKYRLPVGARLGPNSFLVVTETQFRPGDAGNVGFAFSALGDSVHLFSADAAGELTGWHSGFSFGAAFNGVSFGRWVSPDGREHFVAQSASSLGAANHLPRVGPAVVTEIHFEPPRNGSQNNETDEFVELRNISLAPLPLFDPKHPTNRWRLRGAVELDFPSNLVLPSGAFAVAVSFDPLVETNRLSTFRTTFNPPLGTPIVGPWRGVLNNAGESLRLLAPDEPVPSPAANAGEVGWVEIDAIDYLPVAPWPLGAAGTGNSLQRIYSRRFGNDPAIWKTAPPTPGRINDPADDTEGDADADRDGLPDAWERAFGLDPSSSEGAHGAAGDPDADGHTNAQEWVAGTHPLQAGSVLRLVVLPGESLRLRFEAQVARGYTVWRRHATSNEWEPWRKVAASSQASVVEMADLPTDASQLYRVSTP